MYGMPVHQSGNMVFQCLSIVFLVFSMMSGYNKDIFEDRTKTQTKNVLKGR